MIAILITLSTKAIKAVESAVAELKVIPLHNLENFPSKTLTLENL